MSFNHGSTSSRWRRLLAVETLAIDRWHDRTPGEDLRARSIAIEVKHFRQTTRAYALLLDRTRQRTACTAFDSDARTKDNAWTGHDRSQCTTTKDRSAGPVEKEGGDGGPLKLLT